MMNNRYAMPLGVYVPGATALHRLAPRWKFIILISYIIISSIWLRGFPTALIAFLVVVALYFWARIPWRVAWGQVWPVLPVLLFLLGFQWWRQDLPTALGIVFSILSSLMLALLVTLTTRLEAMMDALARGLEPLRRFGVPVDLIILAFSLTMRLIPLTFATVYEVLDARKARGLGFSMRALGTPVLVRSIQRARNLSEAMWARGVADD